MQDREPTYPGRVTLTPVYGLANTYDMERADRPLQEGTPLNKASLLKDATAAAFGKTNAAVPDDILNLLSKSMMAQVTEEYTKTTIETLAVGSTITLNVNGTAKEFIVVHQGKPSSLYDDSCNGTWLLMKDCYESRQWHSSNSNSYKASTIHSYLNSTFLNLFDSNIKDAIKQVKIPYVNGTGGSAVASGANGLSAKIFLLSGYEVGWTTSDNQFLPQDGAKLSYFESGIGTSANNKRIAKLNGSFSNWWLRSPYTANTGYVVFVNTAGSVNYFNASESYGIRPALVLPSTFEVYTDSSGNIYTEQEYETKITDVLGNPISIPVDQIKGGVKIAVGSYTGTGTYGSSHPNTLTFEFKPAVLLVSSPSQYGLEGFGFDGSDNVTYAMIGSVLTTSYKVSFGIGVNTNSTGYGKKSSDGQKFFWYNTASAANQWNASKKVYHYIAIG